MASIGAAVLSKPVSLLGFLLVSAALVLAVTGTCAAIYGLARTERQAATLGNMIFLLMGFLGGGFIRVDSLPPSLKAIAPATPLYWATQAYKSLLEGGAGVAEVARPAAILFVMGGVLLVVGAGALRRAARTGARA
jgi:ABC-2 type transport system permease protein